MECSETKILDAEWFVFGNYLFCTLYSTCTGKYYDGKYYEYSFGGHITGNHFSRLDPPLSSLRQQFILYRRFSLSADYRLINLNMYNFNLFSTFVIFDNHLDSLRFVRINYIWCLKCVGHVRAIYIDILNIKISLMDIKLLKTLKHLLQ